MNILVMGAGAVGSVTGGLLAQAGHTVTLIGRPGHMRAIRDHGLGIEGIWGDHVVGGLLTATSPADVTRRDFDALLLCTKAYDTAAALREVLPLAGAHTLVVSLQNGLGNVETIASLAGDARTIGGRVIFGSELVQDGRVRVTVFGGEVMLGHPDGSPPSPQLLELAAAMDHAGVPTKATDQIMGFIWGKVLYNSCLNPLSALLDVPYGALLKSEDTRAVMQDVLAEAFAAAAAAGVRLFWERPEDYQRLLFEELIPPTAAHYASMRADLLRQRRTEIDALNGALARIGGQHGLALPVNTLLTRLVHAREAQYLALAGRMTTGRDVSAS